MLPHETKPLAMKSTPFEGFNRYLGKPKDWRPEIATCKELAVRDDDSIAPGFHTICSVWVPTEEERAKIAAGENIELIVCGVSHPAVALRTTSVPIYL